MRKTQQSTFEMDKQPFCALETVSISQKSVTTKCDSSRPNHGDNAPQIMSVVLDFFNGNNA